MVPLPPPPLPPPLSPRPTPTTYWPQECQRAWLFPHGSGGKTLEGVLVLVLLPKKKIPTHTHPPSTPTPTCPHDENTPTHTPHTRTHHTASVVWGVGVCLPTVRPALLLLGSSLSALPPPPSLSLTPPHTHTPTHSPTPPMATHAHSHTPQPMCALEPCGCAWVGLCVQPSFSGRVLPRFFGEHCPTGTHTRTSHHGPPTIGTTAPPLTVQRTTRTRARHPHHGVAFVLFFGGVASPALFFGGGVHAVLFGFWVARRAIARPLHPPPPHHPFSLIAHTLHTPSLGGSRLRAAARGPALLPPPPSPRF